MTALYTGRVRIPLPYNFRILRVSAVSFACGEDVGSTVDTLEWQYMANSELKLNTCLGHISVWEINHTVHIIGTSPSLMTIADHDREPRITKEIYHDCIGKIHEWIDIYEMQPQLMQYKIIQSQNDMVCRNKISVPPGPHVKASFLYIQPMNIVCS